MKTYFALGLMSGTSLDGLDICYAKLFKSETGWKFEILNAETIPYSSHWTEKLSHAIKLSAPDLLNLNSEYGFYLGEKVAEFISKYKIKNLDVIASHGHTVHHLPERKFTYQLGDGRAIKIRNPYPVVYDFRSQDVLLGGHGAPLVPIGDELLFSEFDACLNLGGFSNISLKKEGKRIAFDICPLNNVLNYFAEKLDHPFDDQGHLARKGQPNISILNQLKEIEFYKQSPPKSLGIEFVEREILPLMTDLPENNLATFTEHAAHQISEIFLEYAPKTILITGGGSHNQFLIEQLQKKSEINITIPHSDLINYKEALIFAFMGVLRQCGENNVLASSTGSSYDHCSGILI